MSTYEDRTQRIMYDNGDLSSWMGVTNVLQWLDQHPEAVPKPTVTFSRFHDLMNSYNLHREDTLKGINGLQLAAHLGIEIVPDPKPTNAERLEGLIREINANHYQDAGSIAESLIERGAEVPEVDHE